MRNNFIKFSKKISTNKLLILSIAMLFSNFMFFEGKQALLPDQYRVCTTTDCNSAVRWADHFPFVEFVLNPELPSVYDADDFAKAEVKAAGESWFREGDASFTMGLKEITSLKGAGSPPIQNCTEVGRTELLKMSNMVYSESAQDPDCTGTACSFVWSCENEILHFDTQVNGYETRFSFGKGVKTPGADSLYAVLQHEFGHVAGLSHCLPGQSCVSSPFSNPEETSAMYGFYAVTDKLGADDISGIQTLYGKLKSQFPKTGDYVLSKEEIQSISTLLTMQHEQGYDTPQARQDQAETVQETMSFVDSGNINKTLEWVPVRGYTQGMTAIQYFDMVNGEIKNNISQVNDLQLEYMKRTLSSGVIIMNDLLDKYETNERTPGKSVFEYINQSNLDLRQVLIDEQKRRGL